jgi:Fe(3+) dicitrate transport protein
MKRSLPLGCVLALAVAPVPRSAAAQTAEPSPEAPIEVNAGPAPPEQAQPPANSGPPAAPAEAIEVGPAPATPGPARARNTGDEPIEVTVVGTSLARTAGSAHVVREKQLARFEYDDPQAALLNVPGVYVRVEDGVGLRPNIGIRGATSDRSKKVALMEDGIPFAPAPYSAPAAYYFPLITRMSAVRVIKGPSAISYGPQTIGGAIDLRTRAIPGSAHGYLDIAGGEYGYGKLHAWYGSSDERTGFLIEGVHLRNAGFKELDGGGDTGFWKNEWMFKARFVPDPTASTHNEIGVKLGYSDETSDETYLGLTNADLEANPDRRYLASRFDRMQNHRTQIVLEHVMQPSPEFELRTSLYRIDFSRTWRKVNDFQGVSIADVLADPDTARNRIYYDVLTGAANASDPSETILIGPNRRIFVSQGLQLIGQYRVREGKFEQRLEYGVRLHNDSVNRHHSEDGFLMQERELLPDGLPTRVTADETDQAYALAFHVTDALGWGPITLTPGVRVEVIRGISTDRLNGVRAAGIQKALLPGIGAFYAFTNEFGVLAGVHKGFSPAPPGQAVDPEHATNYEAGVRYSRGAARAELIGFFSDYQNLTSTCGLSSGCSEADLDRQFDAGSAHIWGFETFAENEFDLGGGWNVPATVAYTLTRAEFRESFDSAEPSWGNVQAGFEVPYIPEHQVSASAGFGSADWQVMLGGTYTSEMRELAGVGEPPPAARADSLFLLDGSAFYRIIKPLRVYLNVRNILDERGILSHRPFGARPNAPRWLQVGLKCEF